TLDEPDTESFTVTLSGPNPAATLGDASEIGQIQDDDPQPVLAVTAASTQSESSTPYVFSIALSAASAQTVTVGFATSDGNATTAGSDYAGLTTNLTFAPGSTTAAVTVQVNGDTLPESDETFKLNVNPASNAIGPGAPAVATIVNDDGQPTISVASRSVPEGS